MPASPSPAMRSWLPVSTPAGILIWSLRSTVDLAVAVAVLAGRGDHRAGAAAAAARARHAEEALLEGDLARAARRRGRWWAVVPGAAPLPWHVAQASARGIWMWVSVPKAASSKLSSRL